MTDRTHRAPQVGALCCDPAARTASTAAPPAASAATGGCIVPEHSPYKDPQ